MPSAALAPKPVSGEKGLRSHPKDCRRVASHAELHHRQTPARAEAARLRHRPADLALEHRQLRRRPAPLDRANEYALPYDEDTP
jgi:hypothetical protein